MDTLTLAKNMIREVRMTDSNFSGKVAKITGAGLNRKNVREILEGLNNGALIIQKASGMDSETAGMLHVALQQEKFGIVVIMEDTKKAIQKLFLGTPQLFGDFTARVDLEALSNDTLVSFGRRYAREKEYSIDDLGMLARALSAAPSSAQTLMPACAIAPAMAQASILRNILFPRNAALARLSSLGYIPPPSFQQPSLFPAAFYAEPIAYCAV